MNLFMLKPYSLMFYLTLFLGIFISLTSNNWFTIWMGLEINMYSFIPLLLQSNKNQEKEAAIKYFIIQALASGLLLTASLLLYSSVSTLLITLSLMMKLALAPCHFWFPSVMNSLPWNMCWLLTTLQKISPLFLFSQIMFDFNALLLTFISALSALTGAIGGLKQTQLRAILAYSSIGHLGWLAAATATSFCTLNLYLSSYIFMISTIMFLANMNRMKTATPLIFPNSKHLLSLSLLSLGGLPPLFGFFPKLILLFSLIQMNLILLPFILVMSSTINLYYYLKIVFFSSLQAPSMNTFFALNKSSTTILFPFIFSVSTIMGLFLVMMFL
uniref:NADH dehydrogenase subunit 2 n=1 Tax=Loimia medusa TaxID=167822 RepID=UPI0031F42299